MSRINRIPDGFQSLLGTKSLGRNPSELGQIVTPTVAMEKYYLTNIGLEKEQGTYTGAAGVGETAALTIPNGEAWAVLFAGTNYLTSTAVGTAEIATGIILPSDIPTEQAIPITPTAGTGSLGGALGAGGSINTSVFMQGFVFPSGTQFVTIVGFVSAAAPVVIRTAVLFSRLPT